MKVVAGDGNCMFRAVADQVYGDEEMHEKVRACCLDYMVCPRIRKFSIHIVLVLDCLLT